MPVRGLPRLRAGTLRLLVVFSSPQRLDFGFTLRESQPEGLVAAKAGASELFLPRRSALSFSLL